MLRGFRWQLSALVLATIVFGISFTLTLSDEDAAPTTPPVAASTTPPPVATLAATPGVLAPFTPQPIDNSIPTYREALVGRVQRLNPLYTGLNPVDRDISALIFEGLVRINQYGEPLPALARDWVISSDGLEYVVRLRDDVLWQDGIPFNAADVVYTMSILRSPDFSGPIALRNFWRTVETDQLGEHLVRFRLSQPLSSFLEALRIGILPVHALAGTTASQLVSHPFNLRPIGTGPYQLDSLVGDSAGHIQEVSLRAAPVYRRRPEGQQGYALEQISFQIFDTFEDALRALQNDSAQGLAARNRDERLLLVDTVDDIHTAIEPTVGALIFNWANPDSALFREQRARVALETGLERTLLVERNLPGVAIRADSPMLPGSWAYDPNATWPAYDPALARELLETAISRLDRTETLDEETDESSNTSSAVSFEILAPSGTPLAAIAAEIAAQWSQYGIDVRVSPQNQSTYQNQLESGEFDAAIVELSFGESADPDIYEFWDQGQFPEGKNYGGVNDRTISELLERARSDTNGIHRSIYYQDFQHEFIARAIAIPLYYPLYTYATTTDLNGVQLGLISSPADRFRNIQDWWIESGN